MEPEALDVVRVGKESFAASGLDQTPMCTVLSLTAAALSRPLFIGEIPSSARLAGDWLCGLSWKAEFLPCVMKFMVQIPGLYTPGEDSTTATHALPRLDAGPCPPCCPLLWAPWEGDRRERLEEGRLTGVAKVGLSLSLFLFLLLTFIPF